MCAMTAGAKLFQVTFFSDASAKKLKARDMSLEELRDLILKTSAAAKADLPWLKLATFGDKRSDKGSLRHNANVLSISGIEADYDGEVMSFDEAAKILEAGRLSALLYTSPSHTEDKPRWRVLCRMERLNRIFGRVFAEESFRLSQSYYFGSVEHNSAHRAVIVDGDCIDRRGDLDGGARAEADAFPTLAEQHKQPVDVERRLAAMRYKGEGDAGIHATASSRRCRSAYAWRIRRSKRRRKFSWAAPVAYCSIKTSCRASSARWTSTQEAGAPPRTAPSIFRAGAEVRTA
jgi:hypothetical protein